MSGEEAKRRVDEVERPERVPSEETKMEEA